VNEEVVADYKVAQLAVVVVELLVPHSNWGYSSSSWSAVRPVLDSNHPILMNAFYARLSLVLLQTGHLAGSTLLLFEPPNLVQHHLMRCIRLRRRCIQLFCKKILNIFISFISADC
jgi:hypothetical protein